jgi:hypothetical protein
MEQQQADMLEKMRIERGEEGSPQRSIATQAFLHQMQHDPLWTLKCSPMESGIWSRYQSEMNNEERVG